MRFLTYKQLLKEKGVPYTRVHLKRLEDAGKWPKRVKVGDNRVGWVEDEVDAEMEARAAARNQGPA